MKVGYLQLALGLVLASTVFGCAQDIGDIDRTQANKLEKDLFENNDEWYFRQTVVETDFQGSMGVFSGLESSMKRVRWVITEDVLYAMSTVEAAEGVSAGYFEEDELRTGIVAAFPITGHFDVQRSYNSSTGEQTNVIGENASDREWWDRKYFRVNWSSNMADGMGMFGSDFGGDSATTYSVPQQDSKINANRTRVSSDYIDTTTQYYYEPDIYACYYTYGYDSIYNCEGGIVSVRNSFLKVDKKLTYQPLSYEDEEYLLNPDGSRLMVTRVYDPSIGSSMIMECNDKAGAFERDEFGDSAEDRCEAATFDMFNRFGYFRTDRLAWDEEFGSNVEANRMYYANRWNIWETVFEYDEDGNVARLLDMDERQPKPITYYNNVEYPLDMYAGSDNVAAQWDKTFKQTVLVAQGKEVNPGTMAELEDDLEARYGHRSMYRIERNSCSGVKLQATFDEKGDLAGKFSEYGLTSDVEGKFNAFVHSKKQEFCADLEFSSNGKWDYERVGDLRYSFFNWVEQEVPWLGYGPSAADPLTGEIINGNANFNGTAIRTYGPVAADYIQYINGELDDDTLKNGEHIRRIMHAQRKASETRENSLTAEGKRELARRTGQSFDASVSDFENSVDWKDAPEEFRALGMKEVKAAAQRLSLAADNNRQMDGKAERFYSNPAVQEYLLSDGDLELAVRSKAHAANGPEINEDDIFTSMLHTAVPRLANDRYEERSRLLAEKNIMSLESMDKMISSLVTYSGVADHFKGKTRAEIGDYFVQRMFVGTQLHEVGHTVGLRHNFSASTDVLNYHDTYWDIQKAVAEGTITADERWSVPADKMDQVVSDHLLGQQGIDTEYVAEAEFRLASVMDYTGDFTGRFAGLGKYDQAAIDFAYGEVVEIWDDETMADITKFYDSQIWLSNYREIPRIMAGGESSDMGTVDEVNRGIRNIKDGRTHITLTAAKEQWRSSIKSNTTNWTTYRDNLDAGLAVNPLEVQASVFIDRTVPYEFCTDSLRDRTLNCSLYDYGANQREIVNHFFSEYRLFQTMRRYSRYRINSLHENIGAYEGWVLRIMQASNVPFRFFSIYQWYDLGDYTDDLRDAAIDSINFFAEVMATPEPRRYCLYDDSTTALNTYWFYGLDDVYVPANYDRADGECLNYIDVGRGPGQAYGYQYTNEEQYRITRVGSFIDKSVAAYAMFAFSADFLYSSIFTDQRATNISYWTLFGDEMYNYVRGIILGDFHGFAGVYDPSTGSYVPPKLIDVETFGYGVPAEQTGMRRVFTPMSFSHEFNIIANSMIANSTWQDRQIDFNQYVRIWASEAEAQELDPSIQIKTFTHPVTGQIYRAPVAADGRSITGDLIDWANDLKVRFTDQQDKLALEVPGTEDYAYEADVLEGRSRQLEEVVAKMDMIRYIWSALGPDALR